jgi:hypothetical protein
MDNASFYLFTIQSVGYALIEMEGGDMEIRVTDRRRYVYWRL